MSEARGYKVRVGWVLAGSLLVVTWWGSARGVGGEGVRVGLDLGQRARTPPLVAPAFSLSV